MVKTDRHFSFGQSPFPDHRRAVDRRIVAGPGHVHATADAAPALSRKQPADWPNKPQHGQCQKACPGAPADLAQQRLVLLIAE